MKIQGYCMVLCVCFSATAFSQVKNTTVLASAGGISKSGSISLEWTVGEPFTETLSFSSTLYTQGFHQPLLVEKVSTGKDVAVKYNVRVFPNPTSTVINVQLDKSAEEPLVITLLDVVGKVILNRALPVNSNSLKINVTDLSQGAYLIQITNAAGAVQGNYKLIKAQ